MFKNYSIIAIRNLLKNKLFSIVNIFGLAIGMAACFLIVQYVSFEWSYDKFHHEHSRIYRVTIERDYPDRTILEATAHPGVGPSLKEDFTEVEEFSRIVHQSIFAGEESTWSHTDDLGNEKIFNERRVYSADPSFLTMFSFPFIYGDPENVLNDPSSVVISESTAIKFFGENDPRGKTLSLNGSNTFTVTGVFKDVPENSHIKFDILIAAFLNDMHNWLSAEGFWKWAEYYTYVRLSPDTNPLDLEQKFDDFVERHMGDFMRRMNFVEHFHLQPLTDIHLHSSPNMVKEREVHGSAQTVNFLLMVAALILVVAWINYINLSTSKSIDRAREVGVRKVSGASRKTLMVQFLFESYFVNIVALLVATCLVVVSLPFFNQLIGKSVGTSIFSLSLFNETIFWVSLAAVFFLGTLFSGLYPAFILSSFKILTVLKGKYLGGTSGSLFRKAMVGFQFVISIALIAGTVMVSRQVSYMRNQELGYNQEQILIIKSPRVQDENQVTNIQTLRTELMKNPNILNVAPSSEVPGRQLAHSNYIRNYEDNREDQFLCNFLFTDRYFLTTYGVDLAAGRNFNESDNFDHDQTNPVSVMINSKAAELLHFSEPEDAVNSLIHIGWGGRDYTGEIVGIVQNYHQRSLKEEYDPIIYMPNNEGIGQFLSINMSMQEPSGTISYLRSQFENFFSRNPIDYFFLDDFFNSQYAADQRFGKVFGLFSSLALFVATLGLFGMSTFIISQRIKEIAVRKVLGATVPSIVTLFSKGFVQLILLANVIALPIVYLLVDQWLGQFAFRTSVNWLMFVLPTVILLVITLTTVGMLSIKTISMDLTNSLRSE